jgi:hypothetical protein
MKNPVENGPKKSRKNQRTGQAMWMIFALALISIGIAAFKPESITAVVSVISLAIGGIATCATGYNYVEGRRDWTAARRYSRPRFNEDPTEFANPRGLNDD